MVCSHWYYKARDKFLLTSESAIRRIQDQERGTVLDSAVVCRGLSQDTKIVLWLRYVMCTFGQRWLPWLELVLRSQWRKVGFPWVQETERTKPLIPVSEQNSACGSDSINIYQGHRWRRKFRCQGKSMVGESEGPRKDPEMAQSFLGTGVVNSHC